MTRHLDRLVLLALLSLLLSACTSAGGPGAFPTPKPSPDAAIIPANTQAPVPASTADTPSNGLHARHGQILDKDNQVVSLLGVTRSGTEYACIQNDGIFDGPNDAASVQAMVDWKVTVVRVPLNEDCWLAINDAPAIVSGANYQRAISDYVDLLNRSGLIVILDLHWSAPGKQKATKLQPMPDRDHAVEFWRQVAAAYRSNPDAIFEPFNEPYPDGQRDTPAAWICWRDGGTCPGVAFQAAGMQELVNAIREAGAHNLILLGGLQYSNSLSGWLNYLPRDPADNLAASWHVYNFNECNTMACYEATAGTVLAAGYPVVATEIGQDDCLHDFINPLMDWLDAHGQGYLAWSWNTEEDCAEGPALISDYAGTPTQTFGQGYHDHIAQRASTHLVTTRGTHSGRIGDGN